MRVASGFLAVIALLGASAGGLRAGLCCPPPSQVAWSPDASQLVLAIRRAGLLVVFDADGTGRRTLASGAAYNAPTWSPEGKRVAFATSEQIGVVDVAGGTTRLLAPGAAPAWSPDGRSLVFVQRDSPGAAATGVAVVDVDAPTTARVLAAGSSPVWRPDGRAVTFERDGALWSIGRDGSGERLLLAAASRGLWSPDGRLLAYVATRGGVRVLRSDGSTHLVRRTGVPVSWAPDSVHLAVADERGYLWSVNLATGRSALLSQQPGPVPSADWTSLADIVTAGWNEGLYVTGLGDVRPRRLPLEECLGYTAPCHEGSDGPDRMVGSAGRDVLFPGAGGDVVRAGDGHDRVDSAFGNDRVDGGPGNDVLLGQAGDDRIFGGPGADSVQGEAGRDLLDGGRGDDFVASDGDGPGDIVRCGPGRDFVQADRLDLVARDCERVVRAT